MIIKSLAALCWCPNELFHSGHLLAAAAPPQRHYCDCRCLAEHQLPGPSRGSRGSRGEIFLRLYTKTM